MGKHVNIFCRSKEGYPNKNIFPQIIVDKLWKDLWMECLKSKDLKVFFSLPNFVAIKNLNNINLLIKNPHWHWILRWFDQKYPGFINILFAYLTKILYLSP
jgi:hypothetical protein